MNIEFNKDKTIKSIYCNDCNNKIYFDYDLTLSDLKNVLFDCPCCKETFMLKDNKLVNVRKHREKNQNILKRVIKYFEEGEKKCI